MEKYKTNDAVFSGSAQVHIQGPAVLEFVSLDKSQAKFDVLGLADPQIRIVDTRPVVRETMQEILESGEVELLAPRFNTPAFVTIKHATDGNLLVCLEKTRTKKPKHTLWIASGIEKNVEIPYFEYKEIEIRELSDNSYALFSLYKQPSVKQLRE